MKKRVKRTRAKRTTTAKIAAATKKSFRPVKRVAKKAASAVGFGSR